MQLTTVKNRSKTALLWLCAAVCGAVFLILGLLLPYQQRTYLEEAYRQEIYAVQTLTGGILESHPQLENEIVTLLREKDESHRRAGAAVLSRYGYREDRPLSQASRYDALRQRQMRGSILFAATGLAAASLLYATMRSKQNRLSGQIAQVMDQYLEGDYSYADEPASWRGGQWTHMEERLRRLGGQVRLHQQRLVEEKESTKALVTDISHQLKTPIAALKTCFELYLEAEDSAEQQEFLQRSLSQMDKLEELTEVLVNISRLETAMITLQPEPVTVEELLSSTAAAIREKAALKDIEIHWEPIVAETLWVDRKWTMEAMVNLLDNAVKYSPPESHIIIRTNTTHSFVRVEIQDQGIGVPKKEAHFIFQRFYRGIHPVVQDSEGSGVGLYLTRSILEQQGGGITVRAATGGGSVFVAQLPRQR